MGLLLARLRERGGHGYLCKEVMVQGVGLCLGAQEGSLILGAVVVLKEAAYLQGGN